MFRKFHRPLVIAALFLAGHTSSTLAQEPFPITIYSDEYSLTIHIPGNQPVSVQGFEFQVVVERPEQATGSATIPLSSYTNFAIWALQERATAPACLILESVSIPSDWPRAEVCDGIFTLIHRLNPTDIFWYREGFGSVNFGVAVNGLPLDVCAANVDNEAGCTVMFEPPPTTPTPRLTPTPGGGGDPEDCTVETYEASDIRVRAGDSVGLINAIRIANEDPGLTTICLTESTYRLTAVHNTNRDSPTGLPVVTSEIVLYGNNATISRDADEAFRILHIEENGSLTLHSITIANGRLEGEARGAGIWLRQGQLIVYDSTFTNNNNVGDNNPETNEHAGGAIGQQRGVLTIINSRFLDNTAKRGGAISIRGVEVSTTIQNTIFERNAAANRELPEDQVGGGIAIYSVETGLISITGGVFSGNTADRGAAVFIQRGENNAPNLTINSVSFDRNIAHNGSVIFSGANHSTVNFGNLIIDGTNQEPHCSFGNGVTTVRLENSPNSGSDGTC